MGGLFGGSKSKTSNQAFGTLNSAFSPLLGNAATGAQSLAALLNGDTSGFDKYKQATGFDATAEAGSRGITGNAAASGLLRSGSTGKALQNYGQNIQQTFANNYMDKLLQQAQLGFNAGGILAQAGQTSKSKSKGGLGGMLGSVASGIAASDRRLKTNIKPVRKLDNGLTIYQWVYKDGSGPFVGVMADDVAKYQPEALGPVIDGYQTVDYSKLEGVF